MTPTPEQNAKRETPRTDAAEHNASDEPFYSWVYASFARNLETELQQKQQIIENHCKDWAEDDTAIKELCKRFGVPDVHPVGDDFKSCVECVEELAEKLQQLRLAADGAVEGLQEQLDWLETANHPEHCAKVWRPNTLAGSLMLGPNFTPLPCDCWIASAKKDATERIAAYRAAGEGAPNDTGTSKE